MIEYLTKKFFRAYIMTSPRIVLLFLGLVIAICEAKTYKPSGLSYNDAEGKLTCAFATKNDTFGGECYANEIAGCTVNFYSSHGGSTGGLMHKGINKDLTYTPSENGGYCCKAVHDEVESMDCSNEYEVKNLPAKPNMEIEPKDFKCGQEVTLKCTANANDGQTPVKHLSIVNEKTGEVIKEMDPAKAGDVLTKKVTATNTGTILCVAASDNKKLKSSYWALLVCKASDDTTPSNNNNGTGTTTSAAPDLGRPASLLTIVCSLLALTLNLRG